MWITLSEVRLGVRLIAKQPILSLTIVMALAIGIGLATIGFTLREALLYGQLPFANGERFVRLVLHSEDSAPGAEPVVLVRESLWRRRFGASESSVGQAIQLPALR